jgi:hypothetical protein
MEGAVTAAVRSVVVETHIGTGKEAGDWTHSSKGAFLTAAKQLVQKSGEHARYVEATAAALVALDLP